MTSSRLPQQGPDFQQLRYFKESGGLGFGIKIWANYFGAPLLAEMYSRFDLLPDEYWTLASLYDCGTLTAKSICAITGRPKNSVSRGVTRLIASKRIKRITNPSDRRECFLSLLPEGRKLYEQLLPLCREREALLLRALSTEELTMLDRLIMKLMLFYHQSPEGIGLETLRELGIPSELFDDEPSVNQLRAAGSRR
jgi:DNA-binding MarR family transcriptional regulator